MYDDERSSSNGLIESFPLYLWAGFEMRVSGTIITAGRERSLGLILLAFDLDSWLDPLSLLIPTR